MNIINRNRAKIGKFCLMSYIAVLEYRIVDRSFQYFAQREIEITTFTGPTWSAQTTQEQLNAVMRQRIYTVILSIAVWFVIYMLLNWMVRTLYRKYVAYENSRKIM